ncbi:phosphatidylserine/phosphatidylglycerophosphate/cardiolipin synthase-like enzyme [Streptomyces canus]|nr:phosphatidylserine/phosphatidylglycerophosphate/cardiolipin synthase-like enzyme [Streptomyces canus]
MTNWPPPTSLRTCVDSVASLIGSTDVNRRSMDHDEEVMLAVLHEEFTALLDRDYEADLERSVDIDLRRWRRRAVLRRVGEAAVGPIRRFL